MNRNFLTLSSTLLALAVAAGAFGAHSLRGNLSDYSMAVYEKAAFYHLIHALGLLIVCVIDHNRLVSHKIFLSVAWLLTVGVFLFSGSLYALALTDVKILGAITPFGGLSFIIAWILLAYGSYSPTRS